jgi:hypothetical protein
VSKLDRVRDRLRTVYREGLHAKIDKLKTAAAGFQTGDTEASAAVRRLAHQLKGSSARRHPSVRTAWSTC